MKKSICIVICWLWLLFPFSDPSTGKGTFSQAQTSSTNEPRFTSPPGEETPEIRNLIDKAQVSLASGRQSPSGLLTDLKYMAAHEWPRFRKLIRAYADSNQLSIVTPQEPGQPLIVSGTVHNTQGQPIKGAVMYFYQTSSKGWYSDKAPHISGMAGDQKYARLFGYLKTNQKGLFEFRTIRPAGYPRSTLPAHIHVEIEGPGANPRTLISEIQFDDDPRLTNEMRDRSLRERLLIFPVTRETNGGMRVKADFQI